MVGGGSTAFGNLDVRAQLRAIKLKLASVTTRQDAMGKELEEFKTATKAHGDVTHCKTLIVAHSSCLLSCLNQFLSLIHI